MDFRVPSEITYDFQDRATVSEVAKALLAQEKLFREAVLVIQECFSELEIEHVSVTVREVSQNSPLRHRIEGYIIAALSPGLTKDMPEDILQTLFGYDVPDTYDGFVTIIVLIISLWGAEKVIQRLKRAKDDFDKANLEKRERKLADDRKRLMEDAADKAGISDDQLEDAINRVLLKRKVSVGNQSMDFLAPARRHGANAIVTPQGVEIGRDTLMSLPSDVEMASHKQPTETEWYESVVVKFYAHDLENPKRWAASISDVAEGRKALHLAPDIDAAGLFTRDSVRADVLVTSVLDNDGNYQPSIYYLAKVYPPKAA